MIEEGNAQGGKEWVHLNRVNALSTGICSCVAAEIFGVEFSEHFVKVGSSLPYLPFSCAGAGI